MTPAVYTVSDTAVTRPASLPEPWLADLRAELRQPHDDDDAMLEQQVWAALAHLAPRVCVLTHTRRCLVEGWPPSRAWVPLPTGPVSALTTVETIDDDGTVTAVDVADYWLDPDHRPARLMWVREPACRRVRITYVAGYGLTEATVPPDLWRAVQLLVVQWYQYPSDVATGSVSGAAATARLDFGIDALLSSYALPVVG